MRIRRDHYLPSIIYTCITLYQELIWTWCSGGMIDFRVTQFEKEIILWGVRWYVAYPISYRQLEEMMGERGVAVDHSTLNRWVVKYAPAIEKQFRRRQRAVGRSWRMDET